MTSQAGSKVLKYIEMLAQISQEDGKLTRLSLTEQHKQANALVGILMESAGMQVRTDAMGNIIGRLEGSSDKRALLLGSHLDSVRDAGKFDGPLGVVAPIVCLELLARQGITLPYAVEIIGFCDEEGVRFPSTLLGSRALAGTLKPEVLDERDADNISIGKALKAFGQDPSEFASAQRKPEEFLGFVEVHIEQGPVLEGENLPVGLVTAIAGAARYTVSVTGMAGHAGTVPMGLRKDALVAASECIVAIEQICLSLPDVVGTVGMIQCQPGAGNVIPGLVDFSLDLRSSQDSVRDDAEQQIYAAMDEIARKRLVTIDAQKTYQAAGVTCDNWLNGQLGHAITNSGYQLRSLPSGAGHDAMALADLTRIAMLFVRCTGGISHHPDENITVEDAEATVQVLMRLLTDFNPDA